MDDQQLTRQYCETSSALRPLVYSEGILKILPGYQQLVKELASRKLYGVLEELKSLHAQLIKEPSIGSLRSNESERKDLIRRLREIQFPFIPKQDTRDLEFTQDQSSLQNVSVLSQILRLPKDPAAVDATEYVKKIHSTLPAYILFLEKLSEENSPLFETLRSPEQDALRVTSFNDFCGKLAWSTCVTLATKGHSGYVFSKGRNFHDSLKWVLCGGARSTATQNGTVEFLDEARVYAEWKDINYLSFYGRRKNREDKPLVVANSVEDLLQREETFNGSFFVAPKVKICGLPINDGKPLETSLALTFPNSSSYYLYIGRELDNSWLS